MGIFNPENGFFRVTGKLVDLVILSAFWLFCSLPVVTVGPATAALYHTVVRCIRGNERDSWMLFFRTFKSNLKVGVLTSLVVIPLALLLVIPHELLYQMAGVDKTGCVLYYAYRVFLLLPAGALCYVFPVLSRFTFGVGGLLSTCGKLAIAHLPHTIWMALLFFAVLGGCSGIPPLAVLLPAVLAWAHSFSLERIFKPYIDAQKPALEDEEKQA